MASNTEYIYGEHSMLKMVAWEDEVQIKICRKREDGTYDETDPAVFNLPDRGFAQTLIRDIRRMRDRVWGKDE